MIKMLMKVIRKIVTRGVTDSPLNKNVILRFKPRRGTGRKQGTDMMKTSGAR
jgi:hypothetical protein